MSPCIMIGSVKHLESYDEIPLTVKLTLYIVCSPTALRYVPSMYTYLGLFSLFKLCIGKSSVCLSYPGIMNDMLSFKVIRLRHPMFNPVAISEIL